MIDLKTDGAIAERLGELEVPKMFTSTFRLLFEILVRSQFFGESPMDVAPANILCSETVICEKRQLERSWLKDVAPSNIEARVGALETVQDPIG